MSTDITTPWVTLALAAAMLAIFISADAADAVAGWAYQREGILDGEIWRMFTAHLTHYGPRHLVVNLLAFSALAIITECRLGHARFAGLILVLAVSIGTGLLLLVPAMTTYAGVSGINYGLLTYQGLHRLLRMAPVTAWSKPVVCTAIGAVIAYVLWRQAVAGSSPFTDELAGVRVAWQAHLAGASVAALLAAKRHNSLCLPRPRGEDHAERMPLW